MGRFTWRRRSRTCLQDVKVVLDGGEAGGVAVDDGGQHSGLGSRGCHLRCDLVEACIVAMPPHVPSTSNVSFLTIQSSVCKPSCMGLMK